MKYLTKKLLELSVYGTMLGFGVGYYSHLNGEMENLKKSPSVERVLEIDEEMGNLEGLNFGRMIRNSELYILGEAQTRYNNLKDEKRKIFRENQDKVEDAVDEFYAKKIMRKMTIVTISTVGIFGFASLMGVASMGLKSLYKKKE